MIGSTGAIIRSGVVSEEGDGMGETRGAGMATENGFHMYDPMIDGRPCIVSRTAGEGGSRKNLKSEHVQDLVEI